VGCERGRRGDPPERSPQMSWRPLGETFWRSPARVVVTAFGLATAFGTALLTLPAAAESNEPTSLVTALFTATRAMCGGLASVDTGTHWSTLGEVVVLALIQVGGLGITTC
jgi:trk system potassium uptake protein